MGSGIIFMLILRTHKALLHIVMGTYINNKSIKTGTRRTHTNFKTLTPPGGRERKMRWTEMILLVSVKFYFKTREKLNHSQIWVHEYQLYYFPILFSLPEKNYII